MYVRKSEPKSSANLPSSKLFASLNDWATWDGKQRHVLIINRSKEQTMNIRQQRYHSSECSDYRTCLFPTSSFLQTSSSFLSSARNKPSLNDDTPDVNENQANDSMDFSGSNDILASSDSLLAAFMNTVDQHRLVRILNEQKHIPPGVRYVDFPTESAHEDHTSETIYGMDMHSVRVGEMINDAIISAFAKIAFANSPFWQQRSVITPYLSKQAEIHPERYGREAVMRLSETDKPGAPWLPTPGSEIILVPYSRSLHWTLAVLIASRHQNRRALHQNSLKTEFGHRSFLSSILCHWELMEPNVNLQRISGPRQRDGYNCGVAICLAMYIWLLHPDPKTFDWERLQEISPDVLDEYRNYILYVVATGNVENIFDTEYGVNDEPASEAVHAHVCERGEENDAMDVRKVANHSCCKDDNMGSNEIFETSNSAGSFQPFPFDGILASASRHQTTMGSLIPTFNNRRQQYFSPFEDSLIDGFFVDDAFSIADQFRNDL